jgi:hypothetical protein
MPLPLPPRSRPPAPSAIGLPAVALMAAMLGVAGCSGPGAGYPSLAPRPIENLSLTEPERPTPPPPTADPASVARYAPLVERARSDDTAFRKVLEQERGTIARGRGAATGSDAWTAAQVSLSRIETARGPVAKMLADLDAERSGDPTQTDSGKAVASQQAFEEVQRINDAEQAAVDALSPGSGR